MKRGNAQKKMRKYWRREWSKYENRLDEAPETILGIQKTTACDPWIQMSSLIRRHNIKVGILYWLYPWVSGQYGWCLMTMTRLCAGQISCCVKSYTNTGIMTTKFVTTYSKLGQMGKILDKNMQFWQWKYMGVVSRLPLASPRHRPMEKCHVH